MKQNSTTKKRKGGVVWKYTPARKVSIAENLKTYTEEATIPLITEFCVREKISRKVFYNLCKTDEALDAAREYLLTKSEYELEKALQTQTVPVAYGIFMMKARFQYRDNQGLSALGDLNDDNLQVNLNIRRVETSGEEGGA